MDPVTIAAGDDKYAIAKTTIGFVVTKNGTAVQTFPTPWDAWRFVQEALGMTRPEHPWG